MRDLFMNQVFLISGSVVNKQPATAALLYGATPGTRPHYQIDTANDVIRNDGDWQTMIVGYAALDVVVIVNVDVVNMLTNSTGMR